MKTFLAATAIATGLASTAMAGALDFVPVVEATVISPIMDWSGAYAGVQGSMNSGTVAEIDSFGDIIPNAIAIAPRGELESWSRDIEGTMYGAFAGFNIQNGSLVYGIEGAYSAGSVGYGGSRRDFSWGGEFTSFMDLKARAGFAAGNALLYGFAGGTLSEYRTYGKGSFTGSPTGLNYGAGIDLLITDRIFLGAEYIVRELSGDMDSIPVTIDANVQSVQVRLGMQF